MDCAFCTQPDIKDRTIADNGLAFAFLTYTPVTSGHTLVVPKRHVRTLDELSIEEKTAMETLRMYVHGSLSTVFKADGFNYAWNEGEAAGQTVPHLHLHIVPRKEGDAEMLGFEPREFFYRPGGRAELSQAQLIRITKMIQEGLDKS